MDLQRKLCGEQTQIGGNGDRKETEVGKKDNNLYYEQEIKLIDRLVKNIPSCIVLDGNENNQFIKFMRIISKNDSLTIKTTEELNNSIKKMSLNQLLNIYNGEGMTFLKENKLSQIRNKKMKEYARVKKMKVSYSIYSNGKKFNFEKKNIYPMHSIGKVFTGMLIILLINDGLIEEEDLSKPLQLPAKLFAKLPENVRNRLLETTMLDVMTHQSGLKDYLGKYFKLLETNNQINPVEPEEFVEFIDDDVNEKHKFTYSNAGLLLCGISALHVYNMKTGKEKQYSELLDAYIIHPAKIKSFSVTRPKDGLYNNAREIYGYVNGSPAGGYWISCIDLCKFGKFCLKQAQDANIHKLLEKFGGEFYNNNVLQHMGGLRNTSCVLQVDIEKNTIISIMDIDGKSTNMIMNAIKYFE